MRNLLTAVAALALATPTLAGASEWRLDPTHAAAHFEVSHLMVSTVRGSFANLEGTLVLDEKDMSKSRIEARAPVATINTGVEKRDGHLKSADFFDAEKNPYVTFKSKKVKKAGKNKLKVVGDLTMHGVTKEVTFDVTMGPAVTSPFGGGLVRGFHAETTVDRTDFGLTWNKALEAGGVLVGEKVKIIIDAEFGKVEKKES